MPFLFPITGTLSLGVCVLVICLARSEKPSRTRSTGSTVGDNGRPPRGSSSSLFLLMEEVSWHQQQQSFFQGNGLPLVYYYYDDYYNCCPLNELNPNWTNYSAVLNDTVLTLLPWSSSCTLLWVFVFVVNVCVHFGDKWRTNTRRGRRGGGGSGK